MTHRLKIRTITYLAVLTASLFLPSGLRAQHFSVSVDAVRLAEFFTPNVGVSMALGQHLTADASVAYNAWSFGDQDKGTAFQDRQRTFSAGLSYWPWTAYSSWSLSVAFRWKEYNRGGIARFWDDTQEGDALGGFIGLSYSYLLSRSFDLFVGGGAFVGSRTYTVYGCPRCGRILDRGTAAFVWPEVNVGVAYVF